MCRLGRGEKHFSLRTAPIKPHELQALCWSSTPYFPGLDDQAGMSFHPPRSELPVFPAFCAVRFAKSRCRRAARDRTVSRGARRCRRSPSGASSFRSPPSGLPQRRDGRIVRTARAARYARSSTDFSQERRRQAIQEPTPNTAPKTKSEVQKRAVLVVIIVRSPM